MGNPIFIATAWIISIVFLFACLFNCSTITKESPIFGELYFRPVQDGHFIPDDPNTLVSEGMFNVNDVMNGVALDEGTYFMLMDYGANKPTFDLAAYRDMIGRTFETDDSSIIDMIAFIYSTDEQVNISIKDQ